MAIFKSVTVFKNARDIVNANRADMTALEKTIRAHKNLVETKCLIELYTKPLGQPIEKIYLKLQETEENVISCAKKVDGNISDKDIKTIEKADYWALAWGFVSIPPSVGLFKGLEQLLANPQGSLLEGIAYLGIGIAGVVSLATSLKSVWPLKGIDEHYDTTYHIREAKRIAETGKID